MIRLTDAQTKEPVYVNIDKVFNVGVGSVNYGQKNVTVISSGASIIYVTESPEEVARKVLEYRMQMASFSNDPIHHYSYFMETMNRLAGLEE